MPRDTNADAFCDASGSIYVVTPLTPRAQRWIGSNVESEPWQWYGNGLCIDHRYAEDIVLGMRADGLQVSTANCHF